MDETAFFHQVDVDRHEPTDLARGPWSPEHLHGGPPCALVGRAIDRLDGPDGARVARITFEILRPIPFGPLRVESWVERGGRRVQLVGGALLTADGEPLVRCRGWRIRTEPDVVEVPDVAVAEPPPPPPGDGRVEPFFDIGYRGYQDGVDLRFIRGAMVEPGPVVVWLRPRVPLVEDWELTPLDRVLIAADSGNGVSAAADPRRVLFINTDLSVHLQREPAGEWVALDARTTIDAHGVGLADTALSDVGGRIGRSLQTLFVGPQPA